MSAPVIELDNANRTFPPDVYALRAVTVAIEAGERIALMGPSGSGKSTLLNILGLLDRPTSGRYLFNGADMSAQPDREVTRLRGQVIGFVFQAFHLVPHLTVLENVELGLVLARADPMTRRGLALKQLERIGMAHRLSAFPPTLSGGERQRVAIARARVKAPRLLLCDEPTGNLDSATGEVVLEELFSPRTADEVLIIVTHNMAVADRADRVLHIHDGRLKA